MKGDPGNPADWHKRALVDLARARKNTQKKRKKQGQAATA